MMAVIFFIAHEKGFKFHARPKLADILVNHLGLTWILLCVYYEQYIILCSLHITGILTKIIGPGIISVSFILK